MSQRSFQALFITVCVIAFLPVMFPIFEIANTDSPIVLGLPFGFFWVVMWVVIVAICVVVLYRVDPQNRNGEED